MSIQILDFLASLFFVRWCAKHCDIQPGTIKLTKKVETPAGGKVIKAEEHAVLWPWDILHHLWNSGKLLDWIYDPEDMASAKVHDSSPINVCILGNQGLYRVGGIQANGLLGKGIDYLCAPVTAQEYWSNVSHLPFFEKLELCEADYGHTIPISWHTDGVRVYKSQKAWIYSFASMTRKGRSIDTKMLTLLFREHDMDKPGTHDDIGRLIGWIMEVLRTGKFPLTDMHGKEWPKGSLACERAGAQYAGGWKCAFAAFKADLEARVQVHKLVRNWASNSICEHCLASKLSTLNYANFRDDAPFLDHIFTHSEFLLLNPPHRQSSWMCVRGWDKDRNLDEPCADFGMTCAPVVVGQRFPVDFFSGSDSPC